ncbi:hypothetical protein SDC9_104665 [bioreactor metagenome]|uniref:Glycosyltransferase RgtA/B/C/D-like domain-containing protein n=1 Tax=bioreactor metagenome TaxID=1076179 RepID=A0A645AZV4_9ZZZZ
MLVFYICRKNSNDKKISLFITLIAIIILSFTKFANYNILLLLNLMISYIFAARFFWKKDEISSFLFGFSLSVCLLTKQNVPAILIIIFTVMLSFLFIRRVILLKTYTSYILGGILPVLMFLVYSIYNGSISSFLNYAFLGTSSFKDNYLIQDGAQLLILVSILITTLIISDIFKSVNDKMLAVVTLIFSVSSYILIYPIVDIYHSLMLLLLNLIYLTPFLGSNLMKLKYSKIEIPVLIIIIIYVFFISTFSGNDYIRSKINFYNNIVITKSLEEDVNIICDYIKEQEENGIDVAIISRRSYLYNIPANDYNGILDLLMTGNMGTKSIEDIKALIDEKDIILTNDIYEYQDIKKVREYIFDTYTQTGTIGSMKIYIK